MPHSNNETRRNASATTEKFDFNWMFRILSQKADMLTKDKLKVHGLSLSEFSILLVLLQRDSITQAEISKKLLVKSNASTRNIDSLELKGLLVRCPDAASRRSLKLKLTPDATKLGPKLFDIVEEVDNELLASLNKAEIGQLNVMLRHMLIG